MLEQIQREHDSSADKTFVIYSRANNSIVFDVRTQKPVASRNFKVIEAYLKRIKAVNPHDDGRIVTVKDARNLFFKNTKKS